MSCHLVYIPTPFAVPVVGALLEDHERRLVAIGFACRADPLAAAFKALVEAVHLCGRARAVLDPDGAVWRAMRTGVLDSRAYRPYRADRTYRDAYRADFRDVTDLGAHTQLYLDPRMRAHVEQVIDPPEYVRLEALPRVDAANATTTYLERLRTRGLRAISVDVTTPDVRSVGLHVVRVVVPGLYANGPAAFPFLGGRRLYDEPAALGWRSAPLREDEVVRVPLPYA